MKVGVEERRGEGLPISGGKGQIVLCLCGDVLALSNQYLLSEQGRCVLEGIGVCS